MSEFKETIVAPAETSSPIESIKEDIAAPQVQEAPQEEVKEEQPQEEVKQEESQEDIFTKRFATLSKREKKLQEERAKYKEYENKIKEYESIKEQGVAKALEQFGFSLDDVISYALGEDAPQPEPKDPNTQLREEFEAYKKQQEDERAQRELAKKQAEERQIEQAINNHKQSINDHISQNASKYELINAQGNHELVWEVTEAHYNETGDILSVEDASDKVEQYLETQVKELLAKTNKFKPQIEEKPVIKADNRTLTNSYVTSTPVKKESLTHEESLKRAAELLKWK